MERWTLRAARLVGAALGTLAGVVAIQLVRLRRIEFLPHHPGFYISHVVQPAGGSRAGASRLRLVVFGDSTTAGVGVSRAEDSLPYVFAQRVADSLSRPVNVVSYGWSGARVADVARIQVPRALQPLRPGDSDPFLTGADLVAVVIGANDATHHTPPWTYRSEMRTALRAIRTAAPGAQVVVAGIPAFRGALRGIEPLIFFTDQYARLLRPLSRWEAGRIGAVFADLATHVPVRLRGRTDVLSSDRFHPSVVGYAAWADVMFEALVAAFADAATAPRPAQPDAFGSLADSALVSHPTPLD